MSEDSEEKRAAYDKMVKSGMPAKDASLMAGYSPNANLEKPTKKIGKALEKAGVTDDKLAKAVKEGLEAQNRFGGKDHNAIVKYLGLAGKWLGYEKDSINMQVGLNFQGQVTDPSRLGEAIKIIEAEILKRDNDKTNERSDEVVVDLSKRSGTDTFEESPTKTYSPMEPDVQTPNS